MRRAYAEDFVHRPVFLSVQANEHSYRLFFPIALLGLIHGMVRMVLPLSPENIYWHREVVIGLFLLPAAFGFLFTAGPRFFASRSATNLEAACGAFTVVLMWMAALVGWAGVFVFLKGLLISQLLVFVGVRFFTRKSGIPVFTPFLFVGLLSGLAGVAAQGISLYDSLPLWLELSRSLYFHGMFSILFFGVGTKFFPVVTGTVRNRNLSKHERFVISSHGLWTTMALLLFTTFLVEGMGWVRPAMLVRAAVVLFVAREGWLLFHRAPRRGVSTFFLKLALWSIVLAQFVFPFFPEQRVHLYHAIFAGGFLPGVIIVMGRVSLAHDGLDLNAELRSKLGAAGLGLFALAAWTRVSAHLTRSYTMHLISAAAVVMIGVLLVSVLYLRLRRSRGDAV